MVEDKKRACKAYRKHNCLANYIEKNRCMALVRRVTRRKKRESFKSFAESLDKFCDKKYVWNRMNIFKNRHTTQRWNHFGDREYVEIALQEVDRVAPQWAEKPIIDRNSRSHSSISRNNRWGFNSDFTRSELERALNSCKHRSSPGLDGIDYKMLKLCPEKYKECLLVSINYSFANGYLFRDWKEVLTIFIGKANQKKVRPILLSCVGKIAERLVNDWLMWLAEKEGWLDKNQNGFRKGR